MQPANKDWLQAALAEANTPGPSTMQTANKGLSSQAKPPAEEGLEDLANSFARFSLCPANAEVCGWVTKPLRALAIRNPDMPIPTPALRIRPKQPKFNTGMTDVTSWLDGCDQALQYGIPDDMYCPPDQQELYCAAIERGLATWCWCAPQYGIPPDTYRPEPTEQERGYAALLEPQCRAAWQVEKEAREARERWQIECTPFPNAESEAGDKLVFHAWAQQKVARKQTRKKSHSCKSMTERPNTKAEDEAMDEWAREKRRLKQKAYRRRRTEKRRAAREMQGESGDGKLRAQ